VENLNQLLADTMTLRDMYKKHHWQVAGQTFYQLHLLYDKHHTEQSELVDLLAERIQTLGGSLSPWLMMSQRRPSFLGCPEAGRMFLCN
jgi:starvation-inducible DNA-binding protein